MAYNSVAIKTDSNGKPIPQYYNTDGDAYEALQGDGGGMDVRVVEVLAAALETGLNTYEKVTCASADTNYAAAADVPAGARYVSIYCASLVILALDEATTASVGMVVAPGTCPHIRAVDGGRVNVQSPTAGAVVYVSYIG